MITGYQTNHLKILLRDMITLIIILVVAFMVFGITVDTSKGENLSSKYCPVTTSELAEEQFSLDYQGQHINFCCNKCKKEFINNPDEYIANLVNEEVDTSQSMLSHDHNMGTRQHGDNGEIPEKLSKKDIDTTTKNSHDHETDHAEKSSLAGLVGKFHPMFTHFPIALIFSAMIFTILAQIFHNHTMDYVSVYCIYLAALMGIMTVILGLVAGSAASYPSFLSEFLSWHRLLGVTTGIVTLVTAYTGRRLLLESSKRVVWSYRISLIVNTILVGLTGHLGAMLVFGPDHFNL